MLKRAIAADVESDGPGRLTLNFCAMRLSAYRTAAISSRTGRPAALHDERRHPPNTPPTTPPPPEAELPNSPESETRRNGRKTFMQEPRRPVEPMVEPRRFGHSPILLERPSPRNKWFVAQGEPAATRSLRSCLPGACTSSAGRRTRDLSRM
eukprot:6753174-Prymnesium_polylepis.1